MSIRNRVTEMRMMSPKDIAFNDKNWRTHPDKQSKALAGLLNERTDIDASLVDYADVQMFPSGTTGGVRIVYDVERAELQDPMRQW